MTFGLHHDFAEDKVGWGVQGLEDEVDRGLGGDHFLALNGHWDFVPKWGVHSAEVEE
jgi:hypothetical protein